MTNFLDLDINDSDEQNLIIKLAKFKISCWKMSDKYDKKNGFF